MAFGALALVSVAEAENIHGLDVPEEVAENSSVVDAVDLFRKRVSESGQDIQGRNLDCGLDVDPDYGPLWEACEDVKTAVRVAQLEQEGEVLSKDISEQARRIENRRDNISELKTKNVVLTRQVEALHRIRRDFEALKEQGTK